MHALRPYPSASLANPRSQLRVHYKPGLLVVNSTSPSNGFVTSTAASTSSGATPAYAPPQTLVKVPDPIPGVLPAPAAYNNIVNIGAAKAALPAWKTFVMGIMGGCYLSFGGFMCLAIGGTVGGEMACLRMPCMHASMRQSASLHALV